MFLSFQRTKAWEDTEYWGWRGGARFRILGRRGGGQGGQIPSRHMTSFRRRVPTGFFNKSKPNNYISHLKSDNIENSRIDLKGIILQVPSNQIKVTFIII